MPKLGDVAKVTISKKAVIGKELSRLALVCNCLFNLSNRAEQLSKDLEGIRRTIIQVRGVMYRETK